MRDVYIGMYHFFFDDGEPLDIGVVVERDFWEAGEIGGFDDTLALDLEDSLCKNGISLDGSEFISWDPTTVDIDKVIENMKKDGFNLMVNEPNFMKELEEYLGGKLEDVLS